MQNPQLSCLTVGHEDESIECFCFNDKCDEQFALCPQCLKEKHPHKAGVFTKCQINRFFVQFLQTFSKILQKLNEERRQMEEQFDSTIKFSETLLKYLNQLQDQGDNKFEQFKRNADFFKEMYRSSFQLPRILYSIQILEPLMELIETFQNGKLPWEQDIQHKENHPKQPKMLNNLLRLEQLNFWDDIGINNSIIEFYPKAVLDEFKFFISDQSIPENDFRAIKMYFHSNPHNYVIGVCQKKFERVSLLSWEQIKDGNHGIYAIDKRGQYFQQNMNTYGFQKISNYLASDLVLVEIDRIFNRLNLIFYFDQQKQQQAYTIHDIPSRENLYLFTGLQFGKLQLIDPPYI